MNSRISRGLWGLGAVSSAIIALISYRYLVPHIPIPSSIIGNQMARPWLFVHAGLASTALLVGPWQFLPRLRARVPRLHRWLGRVYIFSCIVGGSGGLLLAGGTTAGPIARAGFGLLAVTWLVVNVQGLRLAMTGRYAEHRQWMIRSFALTFGAVLLRVYLPAAEVMGIPFMPAYRAISWLAWVPNLIVAEIYLRRPVWRRPAATAAA